MKLFILGAAALIAAPVMAQQSTPTGSASPTAEGAQTGATVNTDTQGMNGSAQTMPPAPAGDAMTPPPPPPPGGAMQQPMGAMGTAPAGGQIVMGPMNTTPPPAAVENPPVCKRGQTDDCIEPGAKRARRR